MVPSSPQPGNASRHPSAARTGRRFMRPPGARRCHLCPRRSRCAAEPALPGASRTGYSTISRLRRPRVTGVGRADWPSFNTHGPWAVLTTAASGTCRMPGTRAISMRPRKRMPGRMSMASVCESFSSSSTTLTRDSGDSVRTSGATRSTCPAYSRSGWASRRRPARWPTLTLLASTSSTCPWAAILSSEAISSTASPARWNRPPSSFRRASPACTRRCPPAAP